ncbi:unnamed protein product [Microthlaspi erraticum]|uniref:Reverse transcriptase zinc-binding domain-containing protein n=1 Tax=Microthlaspi erraticum TaxID=1685480 RepID=A0A6D2HWN5_9BRAS|nr:unnamed protein product [Microthlaspi erraticum]
MGSKAGIDLAGISWRILNNPTCLLARILKGKYCRTENFLTVHVTSSTSHGWRGILIGRDLLNQQLSKDVGNGSHTSLWNDPWLSLKTPTRPTGPPNLHEKDILVSDLILHHTRQWNREMIEKLLPHHLNDILSIRPSMTRARDSYIWIPTKSGAYSVKTGYHIALESSKGPAQDTITLINWNAEVRNFSIVAYSIMPVAFTAASLKPPSISSSNALLPNKFGPRDRLRTPSTPTRSQPSLHPSSPQRNGFVSHQQALDQDPYSHGSAGPFGLQEIILSSKKECSPRKRQ